MNIKKTIAKLDEEVTRLTSEYHDLHKELDKHRGVELDDFKFEEVKKIINEIQDKYAEIYTIAYWISHRTEWVNNISNSHSSFMKQLIDIGAIEMPSKIIQ